MTTRPHDAAARPSLIERSFFDRTGALFLTAAALLLFATPEPGWLGFQRWLWVGAGMTALGSALRAWASGYLEKNVEIARHGPYRLVRHPLYLGSLILWAGLLTMAGNLWLAVPALTGFCYFHLRAMRSEEKTLIALFGAPYEQFQREVPALLPTLSLLQLPQAITDGGFSLSLVLKHREWHVPLGIALLFLTLWTFVQAGRPEEWRWGAGAVVGVALVSRVALFAAMDRDFENPAARFLISLLSRKGRDGSR